MIKRIIITEAMRRNILILIASLLLVACQRNVVYSHFESVPLTGWEADSALCYYVNMEDSVSDYEMQITLRHTDAYAYQNLWLFVGVFKDTVCITNDTIECYLADERGMWLGGGLSIHELPLLYKDNYHFTQSGEYKISIVQGMREDTLMGIKEVGVKIIRNEQE